MARVAEADQADPAQAALFQGWTRGARCAAMAPPAHGFVPPVARRARPNKGDISDRGRGRPCEDRSSKRHYRYKRRGTSRVMAAGAHRIAEARKPTGTHSAWRAMPTDSVLCLMNNITELRAMKSAAFNARSRDGGGGDHIKSHRDSTERSQGPFCSSIYQSVGRRGAARPRLPVEKSPEAVYFTPATASEAEMDDWSELTGGQAGQLTLTQGPQADGAEAAGAWRASRSTNCAEALGTAINGAGDKFHLMNDA